MHPQCTLKKGTILSENDFSLQLGVQIDELPDVIRDEWFDAHLGILVTELEKNKFVITFKSSDASISYREPLKAYLEEFMIYYYNLLLNTKEHGNVE